MEYSAPDTHPAHELRVDGRVVDLDDVVYSVIEQRDQPRNANNGQRLRRQ